MNDKIIDVEEDVLLNPTEEVSFNIQKLKRVLLQFRKSIVPLREAISAMQKNELPHKKNLRYGIGEMCMTSYSFNR